MNIQAKPGDYVEIHLTRLIYEGILLEAPESETGVVLLKLDSGYNIGFKKKDILEIKKLKEADKKIEKVEVEQKQGKPNIAMIITGGTIASRYDSKTGGVSWLDSPENLFKFYPKLFDRVNVIKVEVPFMKGSENMNPGDWKKIARIAEKLLNDSNIRGVIITHGTDTLHYTAAALSFFLRNLNKPVALTYSQRSIDRASSDADLNLQCSALAAISDIAEVILIGHASTNDDFCYALPGTKVRKMHSSRRDAFRVVNSKAFAEVYPDKFVKLSDYNLRHTGKCKADAKFEDKVALVKFYPGQTPDILDFYIKNKYKGIVIEMLGLGQIATNTESKIGWTKKIKEIIDKGIIVCATAQTIYGRLDPLVYSTGRELMDTGVIYLEDMLSETAYVKLGWVLGHEEWAKNKELVKEKMLENFSHELNNRLEK
ncbi:MAG TPA: Glu-tRNA(Gln) amidotransferase subunit GatD [Candidatus Nanoarchaeia archaeon]|nr:Glu-tRNA(Gln) amidotransferase subunit GatD [Candidatus Nanoarchaeia archaeon]